MNKLCKVFGHKYSPRFSYFYGKLPENLTRIRNAPPGFVQSLRLQSKRYHYDICIRCGNQVERY